MEKSGEDLRDAGMMRAEASANHQVEEWSDQAFGYLKEFSQANKTFMAEDVRNSSVGTVPEPPSNRAWGAIFTRASKSGIIKRAGYREVKNPKAHKTPATLWESCIQ